MPADAVSLSCFKDGEHGCRTTEMKHATAAGRNMLVVTDARAEVVSGRCQVGDGGDVENLRLVMASHGGCKPGHRPPCGECGVPNGAVFSGGQPVAAELEVVVDAAAGGEEALRVAG